jgi:predicted DNA binding protein
MDLSQLTDRQRDLFETAYKMANFDYPRDSNATAVAAAVCIDPSTFSEHLAVAQRKVLESVLES